MLKLLFAAGLSAATLLPAAASAATLLWTFDNSNNHVVEIEFYSQGRNHVWPGRNEVYLLPAYSNNMTMNLECRQGEQICFGGWPKGNATGSRYWGIGPGGGYTDAGKSCGICGNGNMESIDLIR